MYRGTKNHQKQNTVTVQQKIESIELEIERLTEKKHQRWKEIQDMTVSANKADEGYMVMKMITSDIKRMNTELKKLKKKL